MNTNRAAYWIALGVLALGLNSEYQHGRFVALHHVAERAGSALCRVSTRAQETLAVARILMRGQELPADTLLVSATTGEMARLQTEMLREQARDEAELFRDTVRERVGDRLRDEMRARADVIRAQAAMRAGIEQIQWRTRSQLKLARPVDRRFRVGCPTTGARITVSDGQDLADVSPDLQLEDSD